MGASPTHPQVLGPCLARPRAPKLANHSKADLLANQISEAFGALGVTDIVAAVGAGECWIIAERSFDADLDSQWTRRYIH